MNKQSSINRGDLYGKKICYQPHKTEAFFGITIGIILAFISMIFCGIALTQMHIPSIVIFLIIGMISVLLLYRSYIVLQQVIIFEWNGMELINCSATKYHYENWDDYKHLYYIRNSKAFLYLILSPESITQKELKAILFKNTVSERIFVDKYIVIYLDHNSKTSSQITELIKEKGLAVKELN